MTAVRTFTKIDACTYDYANSGYLIEQMPSGLWDAYLPDDIPGARLWQSTGHLTRKSAASSISMKLRRVAIEARRSIQKDSE